MKTNRRVPRWQSPDDRMDINKWIDARQASNWLIVMGIYDDNPYYPPGLSVGYKRVINGTQYGQWSMAAWSSVDAGWRWFVAQMIRDMRRNMRRLVDATQNN